MDDRWMVGPKQEVGDLPTCKELKTQGPKAFRVIKAQPVEKEGLTGTAAM